jgi:pimeloyl-ACP methyl ester carboxylesterase
LLLVGNSVGGSCALEVARLAPDRVAAIVLVGAKASHRPEPGLRDAAVAVLTEGGMAAAWPEYWAPRFGSGADPAVVEAARRIAFAQHPADVIRGVRAFHGRRDRTEFALTWPKPLVVVSGAQDRAPSPETAAALAAGAPHGAFHRVEDSGHYVSLEQSREFERILRAVTTAAGAL